MYVIYIVLDNIIYYFYINNESFNEKDIDIIYLFFWWNL